MEDDKKERPYDKKDICHYSTTDGRIQFLGDCTHALKGTTVDMVPEPSLDI